jgi:hypothetical protein
MRAGVTDQFEGYDEMDEVKRQDWGDVADVPVDTGKLRDGGPTRTPGALTTTGGSGRRPRPTPPPGRTGKIAPTTTGDATSGGMHTSSAGPVSDATTGAESTTQDNYGPRDR